MYLEHFGLNEPPFRITPHTDFFFDGADRGATLEGLLYAIQHDEGIVKVSGEVGSGKTMLCRVLMERLPENVETIYLANPSLTRDEILLAIAEDLDVESAGESPRILMRELQEHLIASHASGRRVVILIDEAHAMPEDSLEQVRLLSNLETSRHKLLQIVLFGQPELDQMLSATSLRQLRDRITQSFRMRPLTEEEVGRYVNFRLRAAGYRGPDLFTPKAIALVARASSGLTRRINVLADKAMLSAFALDTHAVDEKQVQRAIADAELPPLESAKRPLAYVGVALVAGALVGVALHWAYTGGSADAPEAMQGTLSAPLATRAPETAGAPPARPARAKDGDAAAKAAAPKPAPEATAPARPKPAAAPKPAPEVTAPTPPQPEPGPEKAPEKPAALAVRAPPAGQSTPAVPQTLAARSESAKPAPAPTAAEAPRLRPEQIERMAAYATQGMPLLGERIAATREVLQKAPDSAFSVELYLTQNTDPARLERFLTRARDLVSLSEVYVIPLTGSQPIRVRVVYGVYPTRAEAEAAAQGMPKKYQASFSMAVREFRELRESL